MDMKHTGSAVRGPYRQSYDPNDLTNAYNFVLNKNVPVEKAAKSYGVPITTLKDRVMGKVGVDSVKSGPMPMFSLEQEQLLTNHVTMMAEIGYGYSRFETVNLTSDYAVHLGLRSKDNPLTLRWFYDFLGRWPELKVRKPRALEIARAKNATRSTISRYFEELNYILTNYNLKDKPQCVFNIDEKGLSTDHKPPKMVAGAENTTHAITSGISNNVTIIGAANASGQQVAPFFVFPGKRMMDSLLEGRTPGTAGTVSESGWSNSTIFESYMKSHLVKFLPARDATSPVLVLHDGHTSHISIGLIDWAKENHIILFVLPPHCSHLLQPLYISCYCPFETAWNAACHSHLRESGGKVISRYEVGKLASKVYVNTLTPANILAAFKRSGISPFNDSVISDSVVAPSLSFQTSAEKFPASSPESPQKTQHKTAEAFLDTRGGTVLKSVKATTSRNTLSKIIGGKAITEDSVVVQIQDHLQSHKKSTRSIPKKRTLQLEQSSPMPGPSKLKTLPSEDQSDSDYSEILESDKCCVCKRFSPADLEKHPYIILVAWGQCDRCNSWVHLRFCSKVRVIGKCDSFYCPSCTSNDST